MNAKTITLTDAQIKAVSLSSNITPNLLCLLPDHDNGEGVSAPVLDLTQQAVLTAVL